MAHFEHGRRGRGFTLIELVIAVAVAAIIAGIAYPSYLQYVYKSRRQKAIGALHSIQLAEESYRANHPAYGTLDDLKNANDLPNMVVPSGNGYQTDGGYYELAVQLPKAPTDQVSYTATATALKSQTKDSCSPMVINQDQPVFTGSAAPKNCWGR